eukprot:CAMPEP_0202921076 /NCGR_PEP_ID=MMETSP1392-20130828/77199_1 /ASSEMBLY_ACC=CAM_ASM_000868 /TAXON_ID=225041 /ORGANISM="Chlamydomonas chlamydogama, Strain SAG 11-48b" /LENGTH=120 /DNA_ID=CAMNT_0049614619 /DNA_START=752 /DNA_END=1113 /DNA_ORIENTATION=-
MLQFHKLQNSQLAELAPGLKVKDGQVYSEPPHVFYEWKHGREQGGELKSKMVKSTLNHHMSSTNGSTEGSREENSKGTGGILTLPHAQTFNLVISACLVLLPLVCFKADSTLTASSCRKV